MGQALARNYESYAEPIKNRVQRFRSYHSQLKNNNNLNNNYDIENIKSKIDNLREYLKHNYDLNYEKTVNTTNEGVQAMNDIKYTVKEVSEILGVSVRTVEKYIATGKLVVEWGKGKTGRIRLITSEALQVMKENEVAKCEFVNESNVLKSEEQNCKTTDEFKYEMCIPEKIEPEKKYVTQDQLNAYTVALNNFTESINLFRNEISEVQLAQKEMKQMQDEENLLKRVLEVEEKLAVWREESKQKKPLWKRLFGK